MSLQSIGRKIRKTTDDQKRTMTEIDMAITFALSLFAGVVGGYFVAFTIGVINVVEYGIYIGLIGLVLCFFVIWLRRIEKK